MKRKPNHDGMWNTFIAFTLLSMVVYVIVALYSTRAHAVEPSPEARHTYISQMRACDAGNVVYDQIDQQVEAKTLLTLFDFENDMIKSGAVPDDLHDTIMEFATVYYNSVVLPWQRSSEVPPPDRVDLETLKDVMFAVCKVQADYWLDQRLQEEAKMISL